MFTDPVFERHKADVWPLFWPVFLLAVMLFRQRADALMAQGCVSVGYEVSPFGLIRITDRVFPGAPAGWKDTLYAATGAYEGNSAAGQGLIGDLADRGADPSALQACLILALNWVIRRRCEALCHDTPPAHLRVGLPLPHT